MRILKLALVALVVTATFVACKKDHDQTTQSNPPMQGVYVGKYGFGTGALNEDFKFTIKANGVFQELSVHNGNPTGTGTYTINGNTITATYTMLFYPFNKYSVSGTFNPSTGKIVGTWGYDNNPADGGKMDMAKQ